MPTGPPCPHQRRNRPSEHRARPGGRHRAPSAAPDRMPAVKMGGLFDRFRHGGVAVAGEGRGPDETIVKIDATSLSRLFSAPIWLRDLGLLAWFLVGVGLVLFGLVWLLGLTSTIVDPVIVGAILATVAGPLVTWMQAHRIPRAAGAALVLLGLIALGVLIFLLVFGGIVEQSSEIKSSVSEAVDTMEEWVNDAGVGGTSSAKDDLKSGTSVAGKTLVQGLARGIEGLTSLVFFLTFSVFSTFFLLKDGPAVRGFIDRSLGVPLAVAMTVTGNVIQSLRRYFLGVSIVAAFNAIVVGIGAYLLDIPLWGTIAVVTFVTAYIPFIGAFVSGALAVLLALSSGGTDTALIMLVIVILANGLLQNIVQPIAFGATLDLNPLVVLIVTIGFGAIFGMIGLILGAPLTSAAVHISRELAAAKAAEAAVDESERAPPGPEPSPA
jgi:predicted PurR-regulated permease PerM